MTTSIAATRLLLGVTFGSFIALGLPDGALGVAWPTVRDEFGRSLDDLGIILAALFLGFGTAATIHGRIIARFDFGIIVPTGALLAAIGLGVVAIAPGWLFVLIGYLLLGFGHGLIDPSINLYLALHHGMRPMGLLHASFGLGATIGPLIMAASLATGWRLGFVVLVGFELVVAASLFAVRHRWLPVRHQDDGARLGLTTAMVLSLVMFSFYTGTEVAGGQWAFSILTESRSFADATAGAVVAAYWGGLTAGRLAYGVIGDRLSPKKMLSGAIVLAVLGFLLVWWRPTELIGWLGFPLAGAGLAGIFPLMVLLTPERVGRDGATQVMGFQFTAAAIGAVSVPWVVGVIAERSTLEVIPPILVGMLIGLGLLHLVVRSPRRVPA